MTKDLAILSHYENQSEAVYLDTEAFLDAVQARLVGKLAAAAAVQSPSCPWRSCGP